MKYVKVRVASGEIKEVPQIEGWADHQDFPEGFDGIDLTHWDGIVLAYGRGGWVKAEAVAKENPNKLVAYTYSWRMGEGTGVLLPEGFDSSKMSFYKSSAQLFCDKFVADKIAFESMLDEVRAAMPGYYVRYAGTDHTSGKFEITREQEVFTVAAWHVRATNLEDAQQKVAEVLPEWLSWNERGLKTYLKYHTENPGKGNIQLVLREKTAYVVINSNEFTGIRFNKVDNQWVEQDGIRRIPKYSGEQDY